MNIDKDQNILILIHEHADPDAVGSAYFFQRFYGGDVVCPTVPSSTGKNLLNFLDFKLKSAEEVDCNSYDIFVVLDTPDLAQLAPLKFPSEKTIVIDHHSSNSWEDVELYLEERTSCVELIYEMIEKEDLTKKEGVALTAGILTDSSSLQRGDHRTFSILGEILERANIDLNLVRKIIFDSRSYSEKIARLKGAKRAELREVNGFIIAITNVGAYEGSVASYLLSGGADVAIVTNNLNDRGEFRITSRASDELVDKGLDLGSIFSGLAEAEESVTGGGHPGASVMTGDKSLESTWKKLLDEISDQLREKN